MNKFLKGLPPELAAKMRIEEADDGYKAALKSFEELCALASDAALTTTVVAWDEAKNDEEKEDVVRAGTMVLTFIQQLMGVVTHVIPPKPRVVVMQSIWRGFAQSLKRYDGVMRGNLPKMSELRAKQNAKPEAGDANG